MCWAVWGFLLYSLQTECNRRLRTQGFCNPSLRGSKVHGQRAGTYDRKVCWDRPDVGIKMNVTEGGRFKKKQLAPSCTTGSSSLSWAGLTCCNGISALAAALSRSLKIKLGTKNQGSLPDPSERRGRAWNDNTADLLAHRHCPPLLVTFTPVTAQNNIPAFILDPLRQWKAEQPSSEHVLTNYKTE